VIAPETFSTIDVAHEARIRRWSATVNPARSDIGQRIAVGLADESEPPPGLHVAGGVPLRVALLTINDARVEHAGRRALLASAAEIIVELRSDDGRSFGERASALRDARPDLAFVLAGDHNADSVVELCEALRYACSDVHPQPRVIVSGDAKSAQRLDRVLSSFSREIVPDSRQEDGHAAAVDRLRAFRRGTNVALVLRDEALESLALAVARDAGVAAAVVDVSGSSTSLVHADPGGAIVAAHLVPLGSGRGADRVVARAGLDRVRRWIPRPVDAPGLLERVFNRARWPDAIAVDPLALTLEIALAHEAIAHALADAGATGTLPERFRSAPVVVLTGRLAELPRAAQSLLVAADALRPSVIATVFRDRDDALVSLGGIAAALKMRYGHDLEAIAGRTETHRAPLGVVVPVNASRPATVRVTGGATFAEQVAPGGFFALAASGAVQVIVSGGLRGRGIAGPLGVLIDARGTPLVLPPRDAERVPAVARWFAALDALADAAA